MADFEFTAADAEVAYEHGIHRIRRWEQVSEYFRKVDILRKLTFDVVVRNIDAFCVALSTIENEEISLKFGSGSEFKLEGKYFDLEWRNLVIDENIREALSKIGRAFRQGGNVKSLELDCYSLNADFVALILQSLPEVKGIYLFLPYRMSSDYVEGFRPVIDAMSNHSCMDVTLCIYPLEDRPNGVPLNIYNEYDIEYPHLEPSRFGALVSQYLSSVVDKEHTLWTTNMTISIDDCRALGNILSSNQSKISRLHTFHSSFQDGGIGLIADAFRSNTTVRSLQVGIAFWDLLSAPLQQNSSIQELHIHDILNASQLKEIIKVISETNVEVLHVNYPDSIFRGPRPVWHCGPTLIPDEATRQNLLSILRKNYTLKEIIVVDRLGVDGFDCKEPFKVLTDLNRAGRGYLQEETSTTEQQGIGVLAEVKDKVGSVYFHLRENPAFCLSCSDDNTCGKDSDNKGGKRRKDDDDDDTLSPNKMRKVG